MKLKTKLMAFTAVMALSTGMASAAITSTDVVNTYKAKNYSYIDVKESPTQIKVEAIKDAMYIEVVYDKESGSVISTESGVASEEDAAQTGVTVVVVTRDFENDDQSGDDVDVVDGDDNDGIDDDNGSDDDYADLADNDDNDDNDDHAGDVEDQGDDNGDDADDDADDSGDDDDGDNDGSGGNGSGGFDDNGCDD